LHRDGRRVDLSLVDKKPADPREGVARLCGIGNALQRTIGEPQACGPLHMRKEDVDPVAGPGYLEPAAVQISLVDVAPVRIGADRSVLPAAEGVGQHVRGPILVADIDEIRWMPVEGMRPDPGRGCGDFDLGLVEAGDETGRIIHQSDQKRLEVFLEKPARVGGALRDPGEERLVDRQYLLRREAKGAAAIGFYRPALPETGEHALEKRTRVVLSPARELPEAGSPERKTRGLPRHCSDSVATSFQFGSRERESRAKVQISVTSATFS